MDIVAAIESKWKKISNTFNQFEDVQKIRDMYEAERLKILKQFIFFCSATCIIGGGFYYGHKRYFINTYINAQDKTEKLIYKTKYEQLKDINTRINTLLKNINGNWTKLPMIAMGVISLSDAVARFSKSFKKK